MEFEGKLGSLKQFYLRPNLRKNVKFLRLMQEFCPRIIAAEERSKLLLMDYAEGLPVEYIYNPNNAMDCDRKTRIQIYKEWQNWIAGIERWARVNEIVDANEVEYFQAPSNTVYSFRSGKFTLIDPN